jgi:hypothetical protein
MPGLHDTTVSLRIFGDDLEPVEITRLLGAEPSTSYSKGERYSVGIKKGEYARRKTGAWIMSSGSPSPGDLNSQITAILTPLTKDLEVWDCLAKRFRLDVYCGVFMALTNEGEELGDSYKDCHGYRGT